VGVALITGGANGIGREIAQLLADRGDRVIIGDVDVAAGERASKEIGGAEFHPLDVSDSAAWDAVRDGPVAHHGGLDTLILNAGVMSRPRGAPLDGEGLDWFTHAAYERVVSVNLAGVVEGLLAFVSSMVSRRRGQIIVISSIDGLLAYPQDPLYAMVKAAQVSLVRSLGPILEEHTITINAVCPYAVTTDLTPENFRDQPGRGISPANFAKAVAIALDSGRSGEVWLKHDEAQAPVVHEFAAVIGADRVYPRESDAPTSSDSDR
jgi:NAD(P)-dependent dehydrogenase (short-subunit alcohol dehydrogenase family)